MINAIRILSSNGLLVDVIGTKKRSNFPDPPKFNNNVRFKLLNQHIRVNREYEDFPELPIVYNNLQSNEFSYKQLIPNRVKSFYRHLKIYLEENFSTLKNQFEESKRLLSYLFFCVHCSRKENYQVTIGIDSYGIIASRISSLFSKSNLHFFWSLEITEAKHYQLLHIILKKIESLCHSKTDWLISQDDKRAMDLCKINNVPFLKSRCFFVPHSKIESKILLPNTIFKKKFSLPASDIILIHAGWIHDIMDSYNLGISTNSWPNKYKLVLHERMKRSENDPYIKKLIKDTTNNLFLSLSPVPYDELSKIIAAGDIGVVNYINNTDKSAWSNLTKASGKIAEYLSCGRPIICSNFDGIESLIKKYKCGEIFSTYKEIPQCVEKIMKNYETYQLNAIKCFEKEYKFSKFFRPVLESIKNYQHTH